MSRTVYLVGSVPLADAYEVFRTVGTALRSRLRWVPDGETGARLDWITWLEPIFSSSDALESSGKLFQLHATAPPAVRYRLKTGRKATDAHHALALRSTHELPGFQE